MPLFSPKEKKFWLVSKDPHTLTLPIEIRYSDWLLFPFISPLDERRGRMDYAKLALREWKFTGLHKFYKIIIIKKNSDF